MKKQGFTLQELLISLAIVGVVAAMTVPAIMGIMPDETKVKYMKAYNALTSITNDLLSDNTIYWTEDYNNDGTPKCTGLACVSSAEFITSHPEFNVTAKKMVKTDDETKTNLYSNDISESDWGGNNAPAPTSIKYPVFLASRMNLQSDILYSSSENSDSCEFTTTDGTKWTITSDASNVGAYTVQVDVNPDNDASIKIDDKNVDTNKVDTFTFSVSSTGSVRATDELGKVFLKTPTDMHRKKEDRLNAEALAQEEDSDD